MVFRSGSFTLSGVYNLQTSLDCLVANSALPQRTSDRHKGIVLLAVGDSTAWKRLQWPTACLSPRQKIIESSDIVRVVFDFQRRALEDLSGNSKIPGVIVDLDLAIADLAPCQ